MTAHLRAKDIDAILEILDGWTDKLTWLALINRIERILHRRYTRLALAKKPRVAASFALAKRRLAKGVRPAIKSSDVSTQVIERLRSEKNRIEMENTHLLEQHLRWRYNAHLHGLNIETLDRPLPQSQRSGSNS